MTEKQSSLAQLDYKKIAIPILIGLLLWFLPIKPDALSDQAWHLFAIFVGTIVGCILQPLPIGAVSLLGLTTIFLTKTLKADVALSGFTSSTVWLIVMAFFLSRGFIKTGLGNRIAYHFVKRFGKSTLGLMYSLLGVDLIVAPATPSNTARAGGIMFPIVRSLAETFQSYPNEPSRKRMGSYLIYTLWQGNIVTSAMFLTAVASNPLAQELANGAGIELSWVKYFIATLVPGLIALLVIPWIIFKIYPPEIKETPDAPAWAEKQLSEIGAMTAAEKWMLGIFAGALVMWVLAGTIKVSATTTAFLAVAALILSGVLTWNDIKKESGAWDTLVWFGILVMMATQLNETGFIPWLSDNIAQAVGGLPWIVTIIVLCLANHYLHYLFASTTAHVSAVYLAFLTVAVAAGVPPMFAAIMLIWASNTMSSTTHYANGPSPILSGSGYVTQQEWWKNSAIISLAYFVIFFGIGAGWLFLIGMV
ncbi:MULTISPECIES: anion permease [Aerococcus]|uniref:anion permease n=1 Tax=Aerococcus TaxID=1375 RepID=UPI000DCF3342|nr:MULTISPECIES: anion permease [Aerococcus]MCY3034496.1 anion permease [Aerococcus mictus]MCY3063450.1 anion permease [Aerococcus mictus]MCY3072935.1 anion permease [Aerococcus mictus]MCY3084029.1 anion permease [Aerococcus mictus]MDK6375353.1 anion permease [Aerococcus urinae]